jgi:acyl-CoA thioester hydrolase
VLDEFKAARVTTQHRTRIGGALPDPAHRAYDDAAHPRRHVNHVKLSACPVVIQIPVQWGEMDAYGHVNNTVLFRYFESARIVFLERCGFLDSYDRDKVGAILHSTECRFRRPLYYPDTAIVGARATEVEHDRFTMEYVVFSDAHGSMAAEGRAVVVSFDYAKRAKAPLPQSVRDRLAQLEESAQ